MTINIIKNNLTNVIFNEIKNVRILKYSVELT